MGKWCVVREPRDKLSISVCCVYVYLFLFLFSCTIAYRTRGYGGRAVSSAAVEQVYDLLLQFRMSSLLYFILLLSVPVSFIVEVQRRIYLIGGIVRRISQTRTQFEFVSVRMFVCAKRRRHSPKHMHIHRTFKTTMSTQRMYAYSYICCIYDRRMRKKMKKTQQQQQNDHSSERRLLDYCIFARVVTDGENYIVDIKWLCQFAYITCLMKYV